MESDFQFAAESQPRRGTGSYDDFPGAAGGSSRPKAPLRRSSVMGQPIEDRRESGNEDGVRAGVRAQPAKKQSILRGSRRDSVTDETPGVPSRRGSAAGGLQRMQSNLDGTPSRGTLREPLDAVEPAEEDDADSAAGGVTQTKTQRAARISLLMDFLQAREEVPGVIP